MTAILPGPATERESGHPTPDVEGRSERNILDASYARSRRLGLLTAHRNT